MLLSRYPTLFQINTRVRLTELSHKLGRSSTLDDIPDSDLDYLVEMGFEWVWLLSVWQTGKAGQQVSRSNPTWRREFEETLPDLREDDISGSGFAITGYSVSEAMGGDGALARLRQRMRKHGLKLMLDFVPNHTGLDHPWVEDHPEYYISGTELDLTRTPQNYTWARRSKGDLLLAHGRDPYFPGWPDTLQLNYANPLLQEAMIAELVKIAGQCDGVRCDMAMLVLSDIFEQTWGLAVRRSFWPEAIQRVRSQYPDFCFMAEVYWDLEWTLQQQGFDYTYDKRLYDRLRSGYARPVRDHLLAGLDYQDKMARFLENHDEPRAAAIFSTEAHKAAAIITFLSPGLRFFHQGQFEGKKKRISPHLCRGPDEPLDQELKTFYERLLSVLGNPVFRSGQWQLLGCIPAWEGNWTWECFIAFSWQGPDGDRVLAAVNYAPNQSQCYIRLPFTDLGDSNWLFSDLLREAQYDRDGNDLQSRGLYLDEPPWNTAVFTIDKLL
ncbi:Alpha amylase catalytic region [uncultured Desulfobacterium sp.]|uniref:Alpha amylase catalytic region n=1 Tax=uncultured Desulfobacterium sp. TaxID=201089 RepID=A0A445N1M2_9BACT|nr:Alpha amylase catalytic region [uncultured Desulfobacterium sp.]